MAKPTSTRKAISSRRQTSIGQGLIHRAAWDSHEGAYSRLTVAIQKADADYYGSDWVKLLAGFLHESDPHETYRSRTFGPRPVELDEAEWRIAVEMMALVRNGECEKAAEIIESLRSGNYRMWAAIRHCVCTCMSLVRARVQEALRGVARREAMDNLPRREWHPFFCDLRDKLAHI
jgi:hypothetical protein